MDFHACPTASWPGRALSLSLHSNAESTDHGAALDHQWPVLDPAGHGRAEVRPRDCPGARSIDRRRSSRHARSETRSRRTARWALRAASQSHSTSDRRSCGRTGMGAMLAPRRNARPRPHQSVQYRTARARQGHRLHSRSQYPHRAAKLQKCLPPLLSRIDADAWPPRPVDRDRVRIFGVAARSLRHRSAQQDISDPERT